MSEVSDPQPPSDDESPQQAHQAAPPVDPDRQCAVRLRSGLEGSRCQYRLTCRIHTEAQKRVIEGHTRPYEELRSNEPDSLDHHPSTSRNMKARIFDPDRQCGTVLPDGSHCLNIITCTSHTVPEKQAISGRALSVNDLSRLHKLNNTRTANVFDLDINCGVPVYGKPCARPLDCELHTTALKELIIGRNFNFHILRRLQAVQRSVKLRYPGGWGFAPAATRPTTSITKLRRRYRRDGMQTASSNFHAGAETMEPEYLELETAGESLERLRQVLYDPVTTLPERDIIKLLPTAILRNLSGKDSLVDVRTKTCDFTFFVPQGELQNTSRDSRERISNGGFREGCTITISNYDYRFDRHTASAVHDQVRQYLERVPVELWQLPRSLLNHFVLHAVSTLASSQRIPPLPYTLELAVVDNKVSLLMRLSHFDPESWKSSTTTLALPIHTGVSDVLIPTTPSFIQVQPPDLHRAWAKPDLPLARKQQLVEIATYIVSLLHLSRGNDRQMRTAAAECCRMFNITLLVGPGDNAVDFSALESDMLGVHDSTTGIISPTAELKAAFPLLPDIKTVGTESAELTVEVLLNRFMHTKDFWIAWADASSTADRHREFGADFPEVFDRRCMCSAEESMLECHNCHACGARTVCAGLMWTNIGGHRRRLCSRCRRPETQQGVNSNIFGRPAEGPGPGFGSGGGEEQGASTGGDGGGVEKPHPTFGEVPEKKHGGQSKSFGNDEEENKNAGPSEYPTGPGGPHDPFEKKAVRGHEYSNEARVYHARYADLDKAYNDRRFETCREGCLELLTEPRLPLFTRIQTLQMLSTLLKPFGAEACLAQVDTVFEGMDESTFQVKLLREDNVSMQADLKLWRAKRGLLGKDIEGIESREDDEPSDEWFQLDRDIEEKLEKEVQEELEPPGRIVPSVGGDVEMADASEPAVERPVSPVSPMRGETGMLSPSSSS